LWWRAKDQGRAATQEKQEVFMFRRSRSAALVMGGIGCALLTAAGCGTPSTFTNGGPDQAAEPGQTYAFNFDDDGDGAAPAGFTSALGDWSVANDDSAPSGERVLRQTGSFANPDFPRIILDELTFDDVTVKTRCRPDSGVIDQACGLMFRLVDSDNYYITRANALEGNVRLYRVENGVRTEFASTDRVITAGEWHTLEARATGNTFEVLWDDEKVLEASDDTFTTGHVGLWTKADSVTSYDDFAAVRPE
jgi:hypothetical protein